MPNAAPYRYGRRHLHLHVTLALLQSQSPLSALCPTLAAARRRCPGARGAFRPAPNRLRFFWSLGATDSLTLGKKEDLILTSDRCGPHRTEQLYLFSSLPRGTSLHTTS